MERVAIIGLGLMGGSLGLALKRDLPALDLIGIARRPETAEAAVRMGAVDRASIDIGSAAEADLVVLACPLGAMPVLFETLAPVLASAARVTDVGSVKDWVTYFAAKELDPKVNPFLGSHPMAGKEVAGIEHAEADLFRGRPWVFTTDDGADPGAGWADLVDAVRAIGARPVFMTPKDHDRYVALVSHLPFLLSAAYLEAVAESKDWKAASALASSGFRDISRLGAGDPEMYSAILQTNRDEVLGTYAGLHRALDEFEAAIVRGDGELLLSLLQSAQQTRRAWAADHPDLA